MKIITAIGARPQFIKSAVVSRAIRKHSDLEEVIIHTGQHYDRNMSDVFFEELEIPMPKYNLGIGGGSHGQNTGRMIEKIETVLLRENPDLLLVYGDTDSTLAAGLSAAKLDIPIAHVEAGLRSNNRKMPEEINRVLTDHLSSYLFTPTVTANENLKMEGIPSGKIHLVGDVMHDAAIYYAPQADKRFKKFQSIGVEKKKYILVTVHRKENTDSIEKLKDILSAFSKTSETIVWPMHPRTRKFIDQNNLELGKNILTLEPLGFLDMMTLEKNSKLIATDSGGVQKEAFFHKIPCITLREETEWVELVAAGVNTLVGTNKELIEQQFNCNNIFPNSIDNFYGNGTAGDSIVAILRGGKQ